MTNLSACCSASMTVWSGNEGTSHYVCDACKRACDGKSRGSTMITFTIPIKVTARSEKHCGNCPFLFSGLISACKGFVVDNRYRNLTNDEVGSLRCLECLESTIHQEQAPISNDLVDECYHVWFNADADGVGSIEAVLTHLQQKGILKC